jgi:NADH-quinone oxidoreductase subunit H
MTPVLLTLDWAYLTYKAVLVVAVFGVCLGAAAYSTWGERKFAALLQDRLGPNRAGIFGLLQPLADGIKMIMKEEIIPSVSNKFLFILGPSISIFTAIMTSAVIPWGPAIVIAGESYALQVADLNIGVLYLLGVVSIGVYGIMIGGWASNNKYALLGALRASSQMISYEIAMGMSIIALTLMTGTLSVGEIASQQQGFWQDSWFGWNVFKNPLTFLIFFICALAETNRAPFDLPECETELVGGYHTEYSSMKLGFYLFAEYIAMFLSSAVMVTFFFGAYNVPGLNRIVSDPLLFGVLSALGFLTKVVLFVLLFMWIRWTIPRFRYDQLMNLGWKTLIPLSVLNLVFTGVGVAIADGWFR